MCHILWFFCFFFQPFIHLKLIFSSLAYWNRQWAESGLCRSLPTLVLKIQCYCPIDRSNDWQKQVCESWIFINRKEYKTTSVLYALAVLSFIMWYDQKTYKIPRSGYVLNSCKRTHGEIHDSLFGLLNIQLLNASTTREYKLTPKARDPQESWWLIGSFQPEIKSPNFYSKSHWSR